MLRGIIYMAVFFPLTGLLALSAIICTLLDGTGRLYAVHARFWGRLGVVMSGSDVVVTGEEHLPDGPVIVMSNHLSNFDILALQGYFPRPLSWIAKKELFSVPIFGPSMRRGGYIPLDRGDGRKALKSIDEAAALIRNGKSVIIFPEGTRSRDGQMIPFKRGGFLLAARAGVPVVPVAIVGSFEINPGGTIALKSGHIQLRIQPPVIIPDNMKRSETENFLISSVRTAIAAGQKADR